MGSSALSQHEPYGAFSEDVLDGLLYITIPLYTAYYLVTRWEDLWIWTPVRPWASALS